MKEYRLLSTNPRSYTGKYDLPSNMPVQDGRSYFPVQDLGFVLNNPYILIMYFKQQTRKMCRLRRPTSSLQNLISSIAFSIYYYFPVECTWLWRHSGASTGKIKVGANIFHSSRISGFWRKFGKIGKLVPKMLQILGILAYQSLIDT